MLSYFLSSANLFDPERNTTAARMDLVLITMKGYSSLLQISRTGKTSPDAVECYTQVTYFLVGWLVDWYLRHLNP